MRGTLRIPPGKRASPDCGPIDPHDGQPQDRSAGGRRPGPILLVGRSRGRRIPGPKDPTPALAGYAGPVSMHCAVSRATHLGSERLRPKRLVTVRRWRGGGDEGPSATAPCRRQREHDPEGRLDQRPSARRHAQQPGNTARISIPGGDPTAAVPQLLDFEAGDGGSTETRVRIPSGTHTSLARALTFEITGVALAA
jgi:hypothetical protein